MVRTGINVEFIFTDIIMPGAMNGWKLAEHIKSIRPDLKILFTTGYSHPSAEDISKDALILKKPYRLPEMAAMIRQAIERPVSQSDCSLSRYLMMIKRQA